MNLISRHGGVYDNPLTECSNGGLDAVHSLANSYFTSDIGACAQLKIVVGTGCEIVGYVDGVFPSRRFTRQGYIHHAIVGDAVRWRGTGIPSQGDGRCIGTMEGVSVSCANAVPIPEREVTLITISSVDEKTNCANVLYMMY